FISLRSDTNLPCSSRAQIGLRSEHAGAPNLNTWRPELPKSRFLAHHTCSSTVRLQQLAAPPGAIAVNRGERLDRSQRFLHYQPNNSFKPTPLRGVVITSRNPPRPLRHPCRSGAA